MFPNTNMNIDKYKANISFTYVNKEEPEKEYPGSCIIEESIFRKFFNMVFLESELLSIEQGDADYEITFSTKQSYYLFMSKLQSFRFKICGRVAKVADIMINKI